MPPSPHTARLREQLDRLAVEATSLPTYRSAVLRLLRLHVPFDAALFHALSPRVPLDTGAFVHVTPAQIARSMSSWDDLAVELGVLRELANTHLVVTSDDAFGHSERSRARFERHIVRPFRMRSMCMVHLIVRGSLQSAIALLTKQRAGFSSQHVAELRLLAPSLAVADALHAHLDRTRRAQLPVRLVCRDERLTPRQREIVEHVAAGQTNGAIAQALGLTVNTTRNHLANIFARVGAANRAELVRLSVLTPP